MGLRTVSALLLALAATSVTAAPGLTPPSTKGSPEAGSPTSAVWPPPGATNTDDSPFPNGSQVGFPGPTPSGDEAYAIATAPVAAANNDYYPLLNPALVVQNGASASSKSKFNPVRSWGHLSPWFSVPSSEFGLPDASPQVPDGCELTQVHLLHRHGARYPTSDAKPAQFAKFLHGVANSTGFSASGPLEFLNTWRYQLGAELLTPFGRQQLFNLGSAFRFQYGDLLKDFKDIPVFRTTSQARMLDSALHFFAGFFGVQKYQESYHQLIDVEADGFNSTLASWNTCPNGNNEIRQLGPIAQTEWQKVSLKKTVKRLQKYFKGAELSVSNVAAMQELCPYETVALGYSPFCNLFTEDEWKDYEYGVDLNFWYGAGPGNPAGAAQGVGYVRQLLARLTQTPITEFTASLNQTLDGNNVTFPLNQPIYIDASHDTVITDIMTALNFTTLADSGPLPVDRIPKHHTYKVQNISPFATHLVGQVLSCPVKPRSSEKKPFIRFLINDGVVPLTGLNHCQKKNKDGLCELDSFVKGLKERVAEVDWDYDCFANYTGTVPNKIIDGRQKR